MNSNNIEHSFPAYPSSIEETIRKLKQDQASSECTTFEAAISNLQRKEIQSKANPDVTYPAVTIDVNVFSKKNPPKFTRTKPVFTDEAKLIIDNAPYDEDAVYEITVDRSGKYSEWIQIKRVD
jgi:hypothetical protein